jgi:subtilisin family serine protease
MTSIMEAKTDNSYYMSGILPDEIKVLPVSASNNYEMVDRYNEGYEYILEMKDRGANIISVNVSAGGPFDVTEYNLLKQFYNAGILVIAAVGNEPEGINIDINRGFGTNDRTRAYPAKYNIDNIIAVSAYDQKGNKTDFANYGNTVDIYMPGTNIIAQSYPEIITGFAYGDGTSQAAAITSGLVGVAAYLYPECNPIELRSLILEKATEEIGAFQVITKIGIIQIPGRQTYKMKTAKISSTNGVGLISDSKLQNISCGNYGIGN